MLLATQALFFVYYLMTPAWSRLPELVSVKMRPLVERLFRQLSMPFTTLKHRDMSKDVGVALFCNALATHLHTKMRYNLKFVFTKSVVDCTYI